MPSICLLIVLSARETFATSGTASELIISFTTALQAGKINDSAFSIWLQVQLLRSYFSELLSHFYSFVHKIDLFFCVFD